jgi:hypothetical protein
VTDAVRGANVNVVDVVEGVNVDVIANGSCIGFEAVAATTVAAAAAAVIVGVAVIAGRIGDGGSPMSISVLLSMSESTSDRLDVETADDRTLPRFVVVDVRFEVYAGLRLVGSNVLDFLVRVRLFLDAFDLSFEDFDLSLGDFDVSFEDFDLSLDLLVFGTVFVFDDDLLDELLDEALDELFDEALDNDGRVDLNLALAVDLDDFDVHAVEAAVLVATAVPTASTAVGGSIESFARLT